MTVHGGGSGTPIVPTSSGASGVTGSLLWRYCQIVGVDENAFWGVRKDGQTQYACRTIWSLYQRRALARALSGAQTDIEDVLGYRLARGWEVEEAHAYRPSGVYLTDYGHIVAGGVRAEASILLAAPVNHAADPAVIGPVPTAVTDASEIHAFYPGADYEIAPSKVTLSGGTVTVEIPRCRLVLEALWNNDEQGIDWADTNNFLQSVDLKRVYNDATDQGVLVFPACDCTCAETTRALCIRVLRGKIGEITARPASGCACRADLARLNYYAGLAVMPSAAEDAIIRLAHTRLPDEPCGCDINILAWKKDRAVPEIQTRERINCPWGLADGAWAAWQAARGLRLVRGGLL